MVVNPLKLIQTTVIRSGKTLINRYRKLKTSCQTAKTPINPSTKSHTVKLVQLLDKIKNLQHIENVLIQAANGTTSSTKSISKL